MKQLFISTLFLLTLLRTSFGQENYLEKGNQFLADKNYIEAEQTFKEAIKSDTSNLKYQCQLALTLIKQERHIEAQIIIDKVLLKDTNNIGAIWYGGINNFQDKNGDLRKAVNYFEKALPLLNEKKGQFYSANWFIGRSYQILLQADGLTYIEVSRMLDCYSTYLRLQPEAKDFEKISLFVGHIKDIRPPDNVQKWINKPQ